MLDAPITTHPTSNTPASQKCCVCSAGAFSGPCTDKLVASVAASFFSALNPDIQAIVVFSIEVGAQFSTALHGASLSNRCQKHCSSLLAARWTPYYPTFASCVAWREEGHRGFSRLYVEDVPIKVLHRENRFTCPARTQASGPETLEEKRRQTSV